MRKQAREVVFKLIFENQNAVEFDYSFCLNNLIEENQFDLDDSKYIEDLYLSYSNNKENILEKIKAGVKGYDIDRIYKIDIALLSLAIAEIDYFKTPAPIVCNEVISLSKKYSTEKSYSFINGILKSFYSE